MSKQYHMLPKKRMEQDAENGTDTVVEGKQAIQSFKETLNLHLAKHIQKELAKERRDAVGSSDSEESAD